MARAGVPADQRTMLFRLKEELYDHRAPYRGDYAEVTYFRPTTTVGDDGILRVNGVEWRVKPGGHPPSVTGPGSVAYRGTLYDSTTKTTRPFAGEDAVSASTEGGNILVWYDPDQHTVTVTPFGQTIDCPTPVVPVLASNGKVLALGSDLYVLESEPFRYVYVQTVDGCVVKVSNNGSHVFTDDRRVYCRWWST